MTAIATLNTLTAGTYTLDPAHSRGRVRRPPRHGHQGPRRVQRRLRHRRGRRGRHRLASLTPIQAASVDTGTADRDGHLRSGDFFDVETYPTITFVSTGASTATPGPHRRPDHQGRHQAGHRRRSSPPARHRPLRQPARRLRGQRPINRKDWGLTWNAALETGGVLVSEKIKLEFDVQLAKAGLELRRSRSGPSAGAPRRAVLPVRGRAGGLPSCRARPPRRRRRRWSRVSPYDVAAVTEEVSIVGRCRAA